MTKAAGVLGGVAAKARGWWTGSRKFRVAGDAARDAGDWSAASTSYRQYLDLAGGDAAIWVQYGHALKESGSLVEAEGAYKQALLVSPEDVDARLHLAHLLKRVNKPHEARMLFADILELQPNSDAVRELLDLVSRQSGRSISHERPVQAVKGGIYFELQDLFNYLSQHTTVTGITRVTLAIVNHVLEYMGAGSARRYLFVHQFRDAEGVMLISHDNMRKVIKAALSGNPDLAAMRDMLNLIKATSPVFSLVEGDAYVILGAFWEFVGNPSWISGMRSRNVKIGSYIYDLIPITHKQYCVQELTDAFTVGFAETARLLDFALTISSFVADEVTAFLAQYEVPLLPMLPVPLAHELQFEAEAAAKVVATVQASDVASRRDYLNGIPFVLCVCTIEARKNHVYLFLIWQRMIEDGIDVPDLVFVGRPGWRVSELLGQIEASRFLNGRLHILNGLTDEELSGLYDRCLFTAFPSFVEGWGLPVGESLAHGKVCVASSASSIPEVGGDYVIYVDPFDIASGYAVISRLICHPEELGRLQERIRANFTPRTWRDVGHDFFEKLERLISSSQASVPRPLFAPRLEASRPLNVKNMGSVGKQADDYLRNPVRLAFLSGWRVIEASGTWMQGDRALVRVQTDCIPGQHVFVLMRLGTSPWVGAQNTLEVEALQIQPTPAAGATSRYRRPVRPDDDLRLSVFGQIDDAGCLCVQFRMIGAIEPGNHAAAPVGLRFMELSYVSATDVAGRLTLLGSALLSSGSTVIRREDILTN